MQVAGNIGMAFDDLDDVLGKITGIRGHEAQTAQPFDLGGRFQQIREIGAVLQVPAVGIDILAQQHDLLHAVPDQPAAFVQDLFFAPAPLPSPDIGHDAVGAELIAAVHDIDAGLVGIFAVIGQVFHDAFRLVPDVHIAAVALQGITEIFRETEQVVGAEDQVHERIGPVDLVHVGGLLHHAAADADLHHGILLFKMGDPAQAAEDPLVRVVPDRTGVEEDKIRVLALNLLITGRPQDARQLLRIPGVHLTAEGIDMEGQGPAQFRLQLVCQQPCLFYEIILSRLLIFRRVLGQIRGRDPVLQDLLK